MIPFLPNTAHAGILGDILSVFKPDLVYSASTNNASTDVLNVQTMPLLSPATNINPAPARGGGSVTIVDDSAVVPQEGAYGTVSDIEKPKNATISKYVVREGDTISSIAKLFDVSPNTIRWANDLTPKSTIKLGQVLTVLPVTGIKHTVQKGDTLASIAKRYSADASDIASFNGVDSASLIVGDVILIPDGEAQVNVEPKTSKVSVKSSKARISVEVGQSRSSTYSGYYKAPLAHYTKTQGIHGYNGVDLAAPVGTPIMASADGDVIVAKESGYNGGYGKYIVISHDNGSQTLYSHLYDVTTYDGSHVVQGQVIGTVGSTGKSTGPHLHFEIRNGTRNPF